MSWPAPESGTDVMYCNSFSQDDREVAKFEYLPRPTAPPSAPECTKTEDAVQDEHESQSFAAQCWACLQRINDGGSLLLQLLASKMKHLVQNLLKTTSAPALCWCEVVALGRCEDCGRAFCTSHGTGAVCDQCERIRHATFCHCGEPAVQRCADCSERVCRPHARGVMRPVDGYGEFDTSELWSCTRCESEEDAAYQLDRVWARTVREQFNREMAEKSFPGSQTIEDSGGIERRVWPFEKRYDSHSSASNGAESTVVYFDGDGTRYEVGLVAIPRFVLADRQKPRLIRSTWTEDGYPHPDVEEWMRSTLWQHGLGLGLEARPDVQAETARLRALRA